MCSKFLILKHTDLLKVFRSWVFFFPGQIANISLFLWICLKPLFDEKSLDHKLFIEMLLEIKAPQTYNKEIKTSNLSKDTFQCGSYKLQWASTSVHSFMKQRIFLFMQSRHALVKSSSITFLIAYELGLGTSLKTLYGCLPEKRVYQKEFSTMFYIFLVHFSLSLHFGKMLYIYFYLIMSFYFVLFFFFVFQHELFTSFEWRFIKNISSFSDSKEKSFFSVFEKNELLSGKKCSLKFSEIYLSSVKLEFLSESELISDKLWKKF